jgi:hypothetical protein
MSRPKLTDKQKFINFLTKINEFLPDVGVTKLPVVSANLVVVSTLYQRLNERSLELDNQWIKSNKEDAFADGEAFDCIRWADRMRQLYKKAFNKDLKDV